jgi:uroporphyrinogen decarboxylase
MDAAIIFADILLVADALGQSLRFDEGLGPVLEPAVTPETLGRLDRCKVAGRLSPVLETVARVRADAPDGVAVIGFCGAPWTVATYMAAGRSPGEHLDARLWAYRDRESFGRLIDLIADVSVEYLVGQIDAGADAVKIFDSWAGVLPEREFERWVIGPTRVMVERLKGLRPGVPVIGFPRGAGTLYGSYVERTGVDAVAIDTGVPLAQALALQTSVPVQGNVDPMALLAGGEALDRAVDDVLGGLGGGPLVFNLGHGVNKETDPDNVARLVSRLRASQEQGL